MFGKSKKKSKKPGQVPQLSEEQGILGQDTSRTKNRLNNGVPHIKDLLAPPDFDRSAPDHIRMGNKFIRNFLVAGFPKMIAVGWANGLYNYEGDLDLALHVSPTDERTAMDELTSKITQFEAQLATELEKGSNRNITRLRAAGLDGVQQGLTPPPEITGNLYAMPSAELARLGVQSLPTSLADALRAMGSDAVIMDVLGSYAERYIDGKRREWEEYQRQISQWELDRYLTVY